jgi:primosomal protein N' (replication factor Y) (superfamily II helicase)
MPDIPPHIISVLPCAPVDKAYSYLAAQDVPVGSFVTIPFGGREVAGIVWEPDPQASPPVISKLKSVARYHSLTPLSSTLQEFIAWVAHYYCAPLGAVAKMVASVPAALDGDVVDRKGQPVSFPCVAIDTAHGQRALSEDQFEAARRITARVQSGGDEVFVLDGVTGAGKTEVYFEAIATAVQKGFQALILMPEIALTETFVARFQERFGVLPAMWHSNMTPRQRKLTWRGVQKGVTKVVIGARSSLFLPFQNLGLIVVDEEHDAAFKQEDGVLYNARDMAVVRGRFDTCPVILASATPSLETMHNVWVKKYAHLTLPTRFGEAVQPEINIIDLRQDKLGRDQFLSPRLIEALRETVEKHQQSLLFLNRRGYAPLTLCRACGTRVECPRCTAWLVEHRRKSRLQCHHCGYSMPTPSSCGSCGAQDTLAACGPGVERIAEEVTAALPEARVLIMASDVTDSAPKLKQALQDIQDHKVDIIIGTQIVAKGHHFPRLNCVGVVDADLGLSGGDLRAAERAFQLLHQVAGRSGRVKEKGLVFLQSWNPEHKVIQLLARNDRDAFLKMEYMERERAMMPPFTRLVALIVTGRDEAKVKAFATQIVNDANIIEGVRILGPAPAQMARIKGRYRYRILIQSLRGIKIQDYVSAWIGGRKLPSGIDMTIDIDPQNFL